MKNPNGSLGPVLAVIVLLSGCGPASNGAADSVSSTQSSPSTAVVTQEPTPSVAAPAIPITPTKPRAVSAPKPPVAGTALAAAARLTVKGRAPKTGYTRAQFGQTWYDVDGNGCE